MTILRAARVPAVLGLAVAGMLAVPLAAPASATTSHCLIINAAADTSYSNLQAAQNAASPGATLAVRGTCTGTTDITKSLTLTGQRPAGFTAPTLNGGGQGSTLTVDQGVALTINTLTITGGTGTVDLSGAAQGGGIYNNGSVTLNDSSITGNTARRAGGGILNEASVTLNGSSSITGNTGEEGGGIFNDAGSSVTLNGSSSITGNTASNDGGGIFNLAFASVTLNGSSSITGNTAGFTAGGILNSNFGSVTGATATNITGNKPNNCLGFVPGCVG
jgi:hypothetical protein